MSVPESMNAYDPTGASPSRRTSSVRFPRWEAAFHLIMVGALALAMTRSVVEDPEDLIGVAIFCGVVFLFPFGCFLIGAMGASLMSRRLFVDQFRRFLTLFLVAMLFHDFLMIWGAMFADI